MSFNSRISQIHTYPLPIFERDNGRLTFFESFATSNTSFKRIFFIEGPSGLNRGAHAHRICQQLIFCSHGSIRLTFKDGQNENMISLKSLELGIFVPSGIWVELYFEQDSSVTVLADHAYSEDDYIRNWDEFIEFKGGH